MELLERIWEFLAGIANAVLGNFERAITSLFGSANARYLRRLQPKADAINALESRYEGMTDEELAAQTVKFRERLEAGETLDDLLVEAFAVCRESGKRFLGMRHYDVQLLGGMILHEGNIAEMVTGEGKTLVATLPAYLNALAGSVHVITVNDYLARRDMEWMGPIFTNLGLKVGAIYSGMEPSERQESYACDITYGTNNEFGFDYLRDNMRMAARGDDRFDKRDQQAQGPLNFAIIDEVDNILIDEARTPLIISGPAEDDITKYQRADKVARGLKKDVHFEVKEKEHNVSLTDEGVREAEKLAGVDSFYTAGNMQWPHLIDNSLKAHYLYKLDVNYVIQEDRIVIVDEFTGRLMEGRQWSDGLHQAVEAKEGVEIKKENQTLATITLQNFFKLYNKLAGMTGTALTEAGEFWKIYQLDVIGVPTNKPLQRIGHPDVIYRTEKEKYEAIAEEIEGLIKFDQIQLKSGEIIRGEILEEKDHVVVFQAEDSKKQEKIPVDKIAEIQKHGRPILVGTVSIEKSERLSNLLNGRGIKHEVLNAKQHKREAEIVAQAGRKGAVTIATNMAGRGTDIILGGNPENMAWAELQQTYDSRLDVPKEEWKRLTDEFDQKFGMREQGKEIRQLGGLHIVGTERHEARRIDLQLRGRCGRQGDPGSSRFYLSLEDDLMRIFAGEWVKNMLTRLGMQEGEAIESKMVSRRIEGAQKKREEYNFEIRKNLLEYDEVMDEQRKRVYSFRQQILDGVNCRDLITDMIREQIDHHLGIVLAPNYGVDSFAAVASNLLGVQLEARDFRNQSYEEAQRNARDEAQRLAESQVLEAIEENLPVDEPDDWNWNALAKWVNARWGYNFNDRELKKLGIDNVAEHLIDRAHEAIDKIDLSSCERYLEPDYSVQTACAWLRDKFGVDVAVDEVKDKSSSEIIDIAHERVQHAYDVRESEYPVLAGLYQFMGPAAGAAGLGREDLVAWAKRRFDAQLTLDDLKNKQRDEIQKVLVACSQQSAAKANEVAEEARHRVENLFAGHDGGNSTLGQVTGSNGKLDDLAEWLKSACDSDLTSAELAKLDLDEALRRVSREVEDKFRPEMRKMERMLLLQILDTAWKEHLLAMDHLRSSVGLRGYAQVDPKVEYKREGMRMFEQMWDSTGAYVTDLVFKMEQLDERFVKSTWTETRAIHDEAPQSEIGQQQQAAIEASGGTERKLDPIRNRSERVGRNAPCPCGSGKKFKQCCMRNSDR
ncbi:SEC-C metal-binding domain-containing protein [Aeoliella sp. ICT_H6.2]|uniref:Protein translocase subunit SecA n=2 Tax=Aeoliella straminimaris TaxID=2954799 RepID=A0A9X2JJ05_9BACT|nr:SEC-C metal-binding domain-containing protein [Aeoliella straminimaris]MCO6047650.1 SEC-C metal-binding domain-containing protein [Aeoliella straminimaris]